MNRICRTCTLIVLLLGMSAGSRSVWAQVVQQATLTGQITNAVDGKPLPFASVYLNGTMRGTTTSETGQFTLANVPFGANELVISYTGFSAVRQSIRITEATPQPVAIALFPIENQLTGVVVTAKKDKNWLRQVEQFELDLIGTSPFARQCRLVNPEVLDFTESGGTLNATASAPLIIDNQALGFQLTYTLLAFRSQSRTGKVVFGGTTLFKEATPESPKQQKLWQQNRQKAYQGSLRHLLASLAAGTYEREGFLVYQTNPARPLIDNPPPMLATELGRHLKPFDPTVMVAPGTLAHERWLVSNSPLEVFYTRVASRDSPYRDAQYAFSQLVLPQRSIGFTVTGQITAPRGFDAVGYLSGDRLATALPNDWQKETPTAAQLTVARPSAARRDSIRTQTDPRPGADAVLDVLVRRWSPQVTGLPPAVFLHIDKPLYLTSSRLWLSGYVINAQTQRSDTALTGPALNVELWAANNTLVQHQWLPVETGRTAGSFRLPDTLSTGAYWLRAYTEVDREQGKAAFERPVWLVNRNKPGTDDAVSQPVVAVKELISAFGGYVEEAPGAPYQTTVTLDSNQCELTLRARSKTQFPSVFVLIEGRGKLVQSARVTVRAGTTTVRWSTRTWPAGTAWVSLLDSTGRVWARRSVRVPERVGPIMASVSLRRTVITDATQTGSLLIALQDDAGRPVSAEVSVAVTDADQVPPDSVVATNLPAHLMATDSRRTTYPVTGTVAPDITLHGRVSTAEKLPVNVVVMVSSRQGLVSRATQTDADGNFQIGQLALSDTAMAIVQVTNRRGKPIDAAVTFGSPAAPFGQFPNGLVSERLPAQWKTLVNAARQRQRVDTAFYRPDDGRPLREVVVRASRPVDERPADVQLRSLHNQVDQTIVLDERMGAAENLYYLLQLSVPGIRVEPVMNDGRMVYSVKFPGAATVMNAAAPAPTGMGTAQPPPRTASATMQNPLFLLDGFPINDTDGTQLLAFSPATIERIEVLKTGAIASIYGAQSSRGVIAFYTKVTRSPAKAKGVSRHWLRGYPASLPTDSTPSGDVLAWAPLASTDKLGQISLPLSRTGPVRLLRVTIQGIANTGQAIYSTQTLPVAVLR